MIILVIISVILCLAIWPLITGMKNTNMQNWGPNAPPIGPHHWNTGYGYGYNNKVPTSPTEKAEKQAEILTNLGGVELDAGNYVSAISDFKHALSIDSSHQGALLGLGEIIEVRLYKSMSGGSSLP